MIDAATGVAPGRLLPGDSDAAWFAQAVDDWLCGQLPRFSGQPCPWRALHEDLAQRYRAALLAPDHDPRARPSACLALAQIAGKELRLSSIGDCSMLLRHAAGRVAAFGDPAVRAHDARLLARMEQLQAEGLDYDQIWEEIRGEVLQGRALMNRADGYWVLDPTPRWVDQIAQERHPVGETTHLLLMTDGFARLIDLFASYDAAGLFEAALKSGLMPLLGELRALEDADPECRRALRLKRHDDATALLLEIEA